MKIILVAGLTAALLAPLAPARVCRAESPTTEAKAHFRKGARYYKQARYREAIDEFQTAYRLRPSGVLFFNLAQCYERLGDIPGALRSYHEYLHALPNTEDRATVEVAMKNLEKRLAEKGLQQILVYSEPVGATVAIDGKERGKTPIDAELPVGLHHVSVTMEGYQRAERTVSLVPEKSVEVDFALQPGAAPQTAPIVLAPEAAPASASAAPAKPELTQKAPAATATSAAPEHHRLYTWIALGVGAAALAAAGTTGYLAMSNSDQMRDGQVRAQGDVQPLHDSAKTFQTTSNILYGVAGVAGAAGVTLFFVEGRF